MSDLAKLTADELRVRFDVLRPKMNTPALLVLAEISRRLERLEKCEAFCKYAQHLPRCVTDIDETGEVGCECGYLAARAALEGK